jgi:NADPH:quinone reductase
MLEETAMNDVAMTASNPLMRAVIVRSFGGPEVLQTGRVPRPAPPPGSTLIQVRRAGVNYFDLERRASGWDGPGAALPVILGTEVIGVRVSDGLAVAGLTDGGIGGYAEYAVVADELAVPIPDGVQDSAALAVLVQGLTAWHVLVTAARLERGESVAITAAAGGVGSLAIQIARWRGAGRVIAVASTEEKRRVSLALGADAAVDSVADGLARRLRDANGGTAVDVVLESVGGPLVDASLEALGPGGRLVAFGQASGVSNTVSLDTLMDRSIGVIGFWLTPTIAARLATRRVIEELLAAVAAGRLHVIEGPSFPIARAGDAHTIVGARGTIGKVTLAVDDAAWDGRE